MNKLLKKIISICLSVALGISCLSGNIYTYEVVASDMRYASDFEPSENCVQLIFGHENDKNNWNPYCYKDGDHYSIGYGTTCTADHSKGQRHSISEPEANQIARIQLSTDYKGRLVSATNGIKMTQSQFDALLSATYNHGNVLPGGCKYCGYTPMPLVQYLQGNYSENEAKEKYLKWCIRGNGDVLPGLITRRKNELALFFSDPPPPPSIEWVDDYNGFYKVIGTSGDWALNLRSEATTNSSVILTMYNGDIIEMISCQSNKEWAKVKYNGTIGYCKYNGTLLSQDISPSRPNITVVKNGISNDRQKQSIDAEVSIL